MNPEQRLFEGGASAVPSAQYLDAKRAIEAMAMSSGRHLLDAPDARVGVMAVCAGAFIAAGALFSVLLSAGVETQGPRRLLEGLGFSAGFFFVILSQAALFTEINVVMPVTLLHYKKETLVAKAARFWVLAFVANLAGALAVGYLVATVQHYPPEMASRLAEIVSTKMAYRDIGGFNGWLHAVLSGMLANWLVGLAAFFATMGRTIIDKFIPVFLAVSLFVAAGFQHSPANMAYFSLAAAAGDRTGLERGTGLEHPPGGTRKSPRWLPARRSAALDLFWVETQCHDCQRRLKTAQFWRPKIAHLDRASVACF